MSRHDLPEQLRTIARGIESGDAEVLDVEEEASLTLGEDRIALEVEFLQ